MNRTAITAAALLLAATVALSAGDTPTGRPLTRDAVDLLDKLTGDKLRAKRAYDDAVSKLNRDAIAGLDKIKVNVMSNKSDPKALDEANRIQAAIEGVKAGVSGDDAGPLAARLAGTTWLFGTTTTRVEYLADGSVKCGVWKPGGIGRWKAIGERTIEQQEPSGVSAVVTFNESMDAAVWVYRQKFNVANAHLAK